MKNILFIIIVLLFSAQAAGASEIFGNISTNPSDFPANNSDQAPNNDNNSTPTIYDNKDNNLPPAGAPLIFQNKSEPAEADNISKKEKEDIKVLGISHYPDNTLLRGSDCKIYIIRGHTKKHVISLKELRKYAGQVIYDVDSKELAKYQTRQYLNKDLIREKGTVEVYVIKNSKKKHILNLKELRAGYFGQEIYNISHEEMMLYPDYPN